MRKNEEERWPPTTKMMSASRHRRRHSESLPFKNVVLPDPEDPITTDKVMMDAC